MKISVLARGRSNRHQMYCVVFSLSLSDARAFHRPSSLKIDWWQYNTCYKSVLWKVAQKAETHTMRNYCEFVIVPISTIVLVHCFFTSSLIHHNFCGFSACTRFVFTRRVSHAQQIDRTLRKIEVKKGMVESAIFLTASYLHIDLVCRIYFNINASLITFSSPQCIQKTFILRTQLTIYSRNCFHSD